MLVDNHGRLPQFLEHFHKLYGKHQNALRGRWEAFWASEQTSVVELVKPEDVLAKMVYAIANPVTGHLVERVHHWPGVESLTAIDHNVPLTATKPVRFFDPENGDCAVHSPIEWGISGMGSPSSARDCTSAGAWAALGDRLVRPICVLKSRS